jgi:hypothetical protein
LLVIPPNIQEAEEDLSPLNLTIDKLCEAIKAALKAKAETSVEGINQRLVLQGIPADRIMKQCLADGDLMIVVKAIPAEALDLLQPTNYSPSFPSCTQFSEKGTC